MITNAKVFPYRREVRPPVPEGLGEFIDSEFAKIEATIAAYEVRIAALEASVTILETP